jgi:hypothetical protein
MAKGSRPEGVEIATATCPQPMGRTRHGCRYSVITGARFCVRGEMQMGSVLVLDVGQCARLR